VGSLRLSLDSTLEEVPAAGAAIRRACVDAGVGTDEAALVELALVEAIQNAIEHGYDGTPGGRVAVDLTVAPLFIHAEVTDTGRPVDLARVAQPAPADDTMPVDRSTLQERGRGVEILRGVFDDVAYSRDAGGNRLVVRRRRRGAV
jgi:serine/threonine-protein kinase RsbW